MQAKGSEEGRQAEGASGQEGAGPFDHGRTTSVVQTNDTDVHGGWPGECPGGMGRNIRVWPHNIQEIMAKHIRQAASGQVESKDEEASGQETQKDEGASSQVAQDTSGQVAPPPLQGGNGGGALAWAELQRYVSVDPMPTGAEAAIFHGLDPSVATDGARRQRAAELAQEINRRRPMGDAAAQASVDGVLAHMVWRSARGRNIVDVD